MRAEKEESIEYVLRLNKEEAKYIRALLNVAPAELAKGILMNKYSIEDIVRITKHCEDNSMYSEISKLVL